MENYQSFKNTLFSVTASLLQLHSTFSSHFHATMDFFDYIDELFSYDFQITPENNKLEFQGTAKIENGQILLLTTKCNVSFEDDTNYSFFTNIQDIHARELLHAIQTQITACHDFQIFRQDYLRILESNPFRYLESLTESNLIDWEPKIFSISKNNAEESQTQLWFMNYHGEYGEETYDVSYSLENPEDTSFYELTDFYLDMDIGDYFSVDFSELPYEEIFKLLSLFQKKYITIEDVVVRTNNAFCTHHHHRLERIQAYICIHNQFDIHEVKSELSYCPKCDTYFMSEVEFARLSKLGTLGCRIFTEHEYIPIAQGNTASQWKPTSLLRSYGYNVNATDNLSANQRHSILAFIYENDIMSLDEITQFIEWLASRNQSPRYNNARKKWQEDIDFLRNQKNIYQKIKVKNLYRKQKHFISN